LSLDLKTYIESGAIECCLLGLATADEEGLLDQMRRRYPELESEISVVAFKLQEAAMAGAVMPPAQVWEYISHKVRWETGENRRRHKRREPPAYTVINLQEAPPHQYLQINIWWRCVFIGLCVLLIALLASSIYFYNKYHQLEDRLLHNYPTSPGPASTK
jgi:hypothetical protein